MQRSSRIVAVLAVLWGGAARADYVITDLGTFGGTQSGASAINAFGQVVGSATFPGDAVTHAFLYSNSALKDLGTLAKFPNAFSIATALNNSGQVAGFASNSSGNTHAFLFSGGAMRDLGTLGGAYSNAYGINNAGQVVGTASFDPSPNVTATHAYLYSGGVMRDLGTLGGTVSEAFGINDSGQIVGRSTITGDTAIHAFLYSNGVMKDLGTLPGAINSFAYAINNLGQVVGYAGHAFLYSDGLMHDLGTLGGSTSQALALNDVGQVVGFANTADGAQHAFLYNGGGMIDLNGLLPPGSNWDLFHATGINDSGQIVGVGFINGQMHSFLLTPQAQPSVPEPGTLALLATALGGLLAYGWWRCMASHG